MKRTQANKVFPRPLQRNALGNQRNNIRGREDLRFVIAAGR
jgi:hypothetical protein